MLSINTSNYNGGMVCTPCCRNGHFVCVKCYIFVHFSSTATSILNWLHCQKANETQIPTTIYIVRTEILSTFHTRVEYISRWTIHHSAHSNQWVANAE